MYVSQVSAQDVLLGRGTGPNDHIGNCTFRDEVEKRKEEYNRTDNRISKEIIIRQTIAQVKARHGRFLKKRAKKEIVARGLTSDVLYEVVTDISALAYKTRQAFRYCHRKKHDDSSLLLASGSASRASISTTTTNSAPPASKMPAAASHTTSLSSSMKTSSDKSSSNGTSPQPQSSTKAASSRMPPTPSIPDKKRKSSSSTTFSDSMPNVDSEPLLPPSCTTHVASDIKTHPTNASFYAVNAIPLSQATVVHTQRQLSQLLQQNPFVQFSLLNHLSSTPNSKQSSLSYDAVARLRSFIEHHDVDRERRLQEFESVTAKANRNVLLSNLFAQSRIQQELYALEAADADDTAHSNSLGRRLSASTDRHREEREPRERIRRELELGGAPEHGCGMDNARSRVEQELGLNSQDRNRSSLVLGNNTSRNRIEQELAALTAVVAGSNRNSNVDGNPLEALRARLQLGLPITDNYRNLVLDNSIGLIRTERDVSALQASADAGRSLYRDLAIDHIARQRVEQVSARQTPAVNSHPRYPDLNHLLSHSRADDGLLGNACNLPSLERVFAACTRPPPQVTNQDSLVSSSRSSDGMQDDYSNPSRNR